MNKNMEIIKKKIQYLESLKHKHFEGLTKEEKSCLNMIQSFPNTSIIAYCPTGRKVDYAIVSIVRELEDPHVSEENVGKFRISTVWLSYDHSLRKYFSNDHVPVIFETMIFSDDEENPFSDYQERYSTVEEAEEGHKLAVEQVKSHLAIKNSNG